MRTFIIGLLFSSLALTSACHSAEDSDSPAPSSARPPIDQIPPPLDIKAPPADATKTASGLVYKKLAANEAGAQPQRGDTALIHYTGWRQNTGDTFFTTKGRGQPIAFDLAHAAPGFREALPLLHKGEKAMLWMPPGQGTAETLVYEVEVVDIVSPPVVASRTPTENAAQSAPVP
jgi:peptidylprolyl isomerase